MSRVAAYRGYEFWSCRLLRGIHDLFVQTLDSLRSGFALRAAVNMVGSVVFCIAAVALGH
jgi:hypothetical protein